MPDKILERINAFTVVINILRKKFKIYFSQNNKSNPRKQSVFNLFLRSLHLFFLPVINF